MQTHRGMTLIDVLVGVAIMVIIFTGLSSLLVTSLKISELAKAHGVAIGIAESQMERVRSLTYDAVGTVGGIPAGTIPQYATTTQNGLTFVTRTLVEYVDDPADGFGAADQNGITTDYKRIKVSTTYGVSNVAHEVDLVSNYAPVGIETTTGGGTLKVSVVNALGAGVAGATVRIVNASTSPSVGFTTFSDTMGTVYLPGAATSSQYQIYVSKNGYSQAQTYARDNTNQNPTPGYITVAQNQTTTGTFAIDVLGTLALATFSPIATTTYSDAFANAQGVAALSNVVVNGNSKLVYGATTYAPSGTVVSNTLTPTYLAGWSTVASASTLPAGTSVLVHVLDGNGAYIPDTALPGNAAGFANGADLSALSTTTYPRIALSAALQTSDPQATPTLSSWTITYLRGPVPLGNVALTLSGAKTIGTTGANAPILKTTLATTTNAGGTLTLPLEWDSYTLGVSGYDVVQACTAPPYVLQPSGSISSSLVLATSTSNSLLVVVNDGTASLSGAAVTLSHPGYSKTVQTDACGNAYFGSLASASDYTLGVSKWGYTTTSAANTSVSGHLFLNTTLYAP